MTQAKLDVAKAGAATSYMSGFANEFATEALPEALPVGRNSPQRVAYGLYAEQISGSAFTAPRAHNRRSWLYRTRPAAMHKPFVRIEQTTRWVSRFDEVPPSPNQLRWSPPPMPARPSSAALRRFKRSSNFAAHEDGGVFFSKGEQRVYDDSHFRLDVSCARPYHVNRHCHAGMVIQHSNQRTAAQVVVHEPCRQLRDSASIKDSLHHHFAIAEFVPYANILVLNLALCVLEQPRGAQPLAPADNAVVCEQTFFAIH